MFWPRKTTNSERVARPLHRYRANYRSDVPSQHGEEGKDLPHQRHKPWTSPEPAVFMALEEEHMTKLQPWIAV